VGATVMGLRPMLNCVVPFAHGRVDRAHKLLWRAVFSKSFLSGIRQDA
jgi:hypothetical protein